MSRLSGSEPSPSDSPVCTKQPRQSPLCMRTTPQQCGHSSSSWGVTERESVRLLRSIFYHPSCPLVADCARFVHCCKAIRLAETASLLVIGWVPSRNRQPCESVEAEKLICEGEHYTMHKHFYGNWRRKFRKMVTQSGKRSGFYAVVSVKMCSGHLSPPFLSVFHRLNLFAFSKSRSGF